MLRRDEHRTKKGHRTKRCRGRRTQRVRRGGSEVTTRLVAAARFREHSSAAGVHRCSAGRDRWPLMSKEGKTAASDEYGRWCGCRSEPESVGTISRLELACRVHLRSAIEPKSAPAAPAVVLGRGPCRGAGSQRRKNSSLPACLAVSSACCADADFSKLDFELTQSFS